MQPLFSPDLAFEPPLFSLYPDCRQPWNEDSSTWSFAVAHLSIVEAVIVLLSPAPPAPASVSVRAVGVGNEGSDGSTRRGVSHHEIRFS